MMLLDGQKTWVELLNRIPIQDRSRYHRFTLSFQGPEPQLDNVDGMQDLKQQVSLSATLRKPDLSRCADNMLACLFYLELDGLPVSSRFTFVCKGRILCRLDPESRGMQALLLRLKESRARFYFHSQEHVPCIDQVSYRKIQHGEGFSTPVEFHVPSMNEQVDIKIDGLTHRARSISNCPYKLSDLVFDQGLHQIFGRPDHKRGMPQSGCISKRRKVG